MPLNGILLIATNEQYIRASNGLARSVRKVMPDIPIDIHCDLPDFLQRDLFDKVEIIEDPHRRSKVDRMAHTRFDRTLYLDSDIRVVADLGDMFGLLDKFDLAIAHAHARNRYETLEHWRKPLPEAFPQYNGGVVLYNSAKPEVMEFMKEWQDAFHESGFHKDQVTLRELLWDTDLRLHTLPPEYNVRYEKYLKVWDYKEADPKILHFKRFKDEYEQPGTGIVRHGWRKNQLATMLKEALRSRFSRRPAGPAAREKVFCIGFHKTGTTSLTKALRILGYRTIHGDGTKTWKGADEGVTLTRLIDAGNYELPTLKLFDAFSDNPYFTIWKELDRRHSGKFILTVRDPEKWIDSCCRYYKDRRVRHMRQWMFGENADPNSSPQARQAWLDAYTRHNEAVREYFAGRSDFLEIDVTRESGWEPLCSFLGQPVPRKPFPHVNKTKVSGKAAGNRGNFRMKLLTAGCPDIFPTAIKNPRLDRIAGIGNFYIHAALLGLNQNQDTLAPCGE